MENLLCVFTYRSDVQRSDVYPIKSTFGSGFELDAKKSDLKQVFVFTRVQHILICVRCERNTVFLASVTHG